MSNEFASFASGGLTPEAEKEIFDTVFFVAPALPTVPNDDMLSFTTVDNLRDLGKVASATVILFREDQAAMLRTLCEAAAQFGVEVKALVGLPEANYELWFSDAAFSAETVSYGPLASEWAAHSEVELLKRKNAMSGTDVESARYTRKTGEVKFADIAVANPDGSLGSDDSELD